MSIWDFDALLSLNDGDILFFDELLNGNPTVLNACLTLIESRMMVSGKKLPDIMIVAAANPQGMVPLTPQIMERFVWYKVKYCKEMWVDFMKKKYLMPKPIANMLSHLIEKEDFTERQNNFFTPRSLDKNVNMLIHDVPTPYSEELTPILERLCTNKLGLVDIEEGTSIEKDEKVAWLKLARYNVLYPQK